MMSLKKFTILVLISAVAAQHFLVETEDVSDKKKGSKEPGADYSESRTPDPDHNCWSKYIPAKKDFKDCICKCKGCKKHNPAEHKDSGNDYSLSPDISKFCENLQNSALNPLCKSVSPRSGDYSLGPRTEEEDRKCMTKCHKSYNAAMTDAKACLKKNKKNKPDVSDVSDEKKGNKEHGADNSKCLSLGIKAKKHNKACLKKCGKPGLQTTDEDRKCVTKCGILYNKYKTEAKSWCPDVSDEKKGSKENEADSDVSDVSDVLDVSDKKKESQEHGADYSESRTPDLGTREQRKCLRKCIKLRLPSKLKTAKMAAISCYKKCMKNDQGTKPIQTGQDYQQKGVVHLWNN